MRTVAIVQARLGSRRLPGKVLLPAPDGTPLLAVLLGRLRRAHTLDEVCVATTTLDQDDVLEDLAGRERCAVYRGSVDDVLGRYAAAAAWQQADVVVRVTGDCPLVDPAWLDGLVRARAARELPFLGTCARWPEGLDMEVVTAAALAAAAAAAQLPSEREHVTPWLRSQAGPRGSSGPVWWYDGPFGEGGRFAGRHLGRLRVTVDTGGDYAVLSAVLGRLGPQCSLEQLVALYDQEPELWAANRDAPRNPWRARLEAERAAAAGKERTSP